ncbi:polysaccharide lyase family 8 protein [Panus rudis PR-1116 ss-1]|nr:polysaccharide lyase family 8 protein [Panus rudis PR-1116 ss-1]
MADRRLSTIVGNTKNATFVSSWLSTLGPDGRWSDTEINYATGCPAQKANWPALVHWERIATFAAAWHGSLPSAEQFAGDPNLRKAISSAMNYWFSRDFTNLACLDAGGGSQCPCSTPGFWNTNWFGNVIGLPKLVGSVCLLLNNTLSPDEISHCAKITGRAYSTFNTGIPVLGPITGANALDIASIGIDKGLLTSNVSLLFDAYSRIHKELTVQTHVKADGIRSDGSFGQHAGILYNGNYGKDFLNDVLSVEVSSGGTRFQADSDSMVALETLVDGDRWMIYRNTITDVLHWDFSALGRFITFPVADDQATANIQFNVTQLGVLADEWSSETLMDAYEGLVLNTTDANAGALSGNRMFYANDYMVHRGPGYVTSVKMFSTRTQNTECLNGQNQFGFHLSDGTVYTYIRGDEYEDIAAAWDWNLIPGITVDYGGTPLDCAHAFNTGSQDFVGGVSDDRAGIAVMQYQNPATQKLSWQKSWFFLDDDVQVVMISGISSSSNAPVFSVLDQRKVNGDIYVDGVARGSGNYSKINTLWHGGVGYVLNTASQPISLSISTGTRSGQWSSIGTSHQPPISVDLFAAWLHHEDIHKAVSYQVYPATTLSSFQSKSASSSIQIVQNDKAISAILDGSTALAVFWEFNGGQFTVSSPEGASIVISSSAAAAVVVRMDAWDVTVADPTQKLPSLTLNLSVSSGPTPSGWDTSKKSVTFEMPGGGEAGSSVTRHIL